MFILILRTCVIDAALIAAGTTLQVADSFVLNDKVRQVPAPAVVPPAPVVAATAIVVPEGSVRSRVPIQIAGQIIAPGVPLSDRTAMPRRNVANGRDEDLFEIFIGGQWVKPPKGKSL